MVVSIIVGSASMTFVSSAFIVDAVSLRAGGLLRPASLVPVDRDPRFVDDTDVDIESLRSFILSTNEFARCNASFCSA